TEVQLVPTGPLFPCTTSNIQPCWLIRRRDARDLSELPRSGLPKPKDLLSDGRMSGTDNRHSNLSLSRCGEKRKPALQFRTAWISSSAGTASAATRPRKRFE